MQGESERTSCDFHNIHNCKYLLVTSSKFSIQSLTENKNELWCSFWITQMATRVKIGIKIIFYY